MFQNHYSIECVVPYEIDLEDLANFDKEAKKEEILELQWKLEEDLLNANEEERKSINSLLHSLENEYKNLK